MSEQSVHLSVQIDRPAAEVYRFAADPCALPQWAQGLGSSVEQVDGQWVAQSPMGRVIVQFAPPNEFGVLDHAVTLPSGETVLNPMRVIPLGDGSEVVFTLRRRPGMSEAEFEQDGAAVASDLQALKQRLEQRPGE